MEKMLSIIMILISAVPVAIPVLFLELLAVYMWLVKVYLAPKRIKFSKFKKRISEVRQDMRKLDKGLIKDEQFENFLRESKEVLSNSEVSFFCIMMLGYAFGSGIILVVLTKYLPFPNILLADTAALVIIGSCVVDEWKKHYKGITLELDLFNTFYCYYDQARTQENPAEEGRIESVHSEDPLDMDRDKKSMFRLRLAALSALAASIAMMYHIVTNFDDIEYLFRLEQFVSPTYLLIWFFLLCTILLWLSEDFSGEKTVLHALKNAFLRQQRTPKIIIGGLEPWEKDIRRMCEKLRIFDVAFFLQRGDGEKMAVSITLKNKRPEIQLDEYFLKKYASYTNRIVFHNMMKFLLAHELSHIYYGDSQGKSDKKLILLSLVICFGGIIVSASCAHFSLSIPVHLLMPVVIYIMLIIFPAFSDERYWGQIDELRADRLGMRVSGTTISSFEEFARLFEERASTEEDTGWYHKSSLFSKILGRLTASEEDLHPNWKTRAAEIEKYCSRKWSVLDHIRYTWRFVWNLRLHKNWRI